MVITPGKLTAWIGVAAGTAALVATVITGYNSLPVPESISEYHTMSTEAELAPMQQSLENIETNSVVDRIMRIQEARCTNEVLLRIVQEQMARYHELTGREFGLIPCPVTPEIPDESTP